MQGKLPVLLTAVLMVTSVFAGVAGADSDPDVCPSGCEHDSIQAAVDAADEFAMITVGPGTYDEQVVVSKNVAIDAQPGAVLTRSQAPGGLADNSFLVVDDGVDLDLAGLTFEGPFPQSNTAGIFVTENASLTARDLTMIDMFKSNGDGEPSGAQFHHAIVVGDQRFTENPSGGDLSLKSSTIDGFGKSAVSVVGPSSQARVQDATVTGSGVLGTGNPAQDTFLLDANASLVLRDSQVSDVRYEASFTAGTGVSLFGNADATIFNNEFADVAKPVSVQAFRSFDNTPGAVDDLSYTDNHVTGAFAALELFSEDLEDPDTGPDTLVLQDSRIEGNIFEGGELGIAAGFGLGGGQVEDVSVAGNLFQGNDIQAAQTDGPFDLGEVFEANGFDRASLVVDGSAIWSTLQEGLDDASASDTLRLRGGPFAESVTIDTADLTVRGLDQPTISEPIDVAADGVALESVHVDAPNANAIEVKGKLVDITLDEVKVTDARNGLWVGLTDGVDGLTVTDSTFEDNRIAIYFQNDFNFLGQDQGIEDLGHVTDVTIENTLLADNEHKGLYAETLSDALLANVTVAGVTSDTYGFNNGIDINLKAGDYANITIEDSTVEDVGLGDPGAPFFEGPDLLSSAIAIKARDDPGRYDDQPATLDDVALTNVDVRDSYNGLRIGEPGVDYSTYDAPTDVEVHTSAFENITDTALVNLGEPTVDATHNWWNQPTGPTADGNPVNGTAPTGESVRGPVDVTPWCPIPTCTANGAVHAVSPHPAGLT